MADVLSSDPGLAGVRGAGRQRPDAFALELLTPTHYARLGVAEDAPDDAIQEAWRKLRPAGAREALDGETLVSLKAVAWPHSGGLESPPVRTRQREVAYAVLSDPVRRAVYDAWLAQHREEIARSLQSPGWQTWLHSRRGHWQIGILIGLVVAGVLVWLAH